MNSSLLNKLDLFRDTITQYQAQHQHKMHETPDVDPQKHLVDTSWPSNDMSMSVDVEDACTERQDKSSNGASLFGSQALADAPEQLPRSNLDNPLSRPIRKHRNRVARRHGHPSGFPHGDFYRPYSHTYKDYDNPRNGTRATSNSTPSRHWEFSPEILKQRDQPDSVAAMADIDFKEERGDRREDRRDDRRDRGGYRGNNKRRRDGKSASLSAGKLAQSVCTNGRVLEYFTTAILTRLYPPTHCFILRNAFIFK